MDTAFCLTCGEPLTDIPGYWHHATAPTQQSLDAHNKPGENNHYYPPTKPKTWQLAWPTPKDHQ